MKIVKISDMTDKEKEKWQKQVEDRRIERERIKEEDTKRANQLFNEEYEKRKKQEEENNRLPTARKNNILTDIKGIGSNFSRSIGNLAINAYKNIGRVNNNLITDRQKMLDENQNKLLAKVMENKGYTNEQIENQINSLPTVESIANNSEALNKFTKILNSVSEPLENKFQEWKDSNNKKIQENIENASNPISQKILELTPSMAQSSVNLIPGGNLLFTAGITQDYYDRAINERGLSEEEANKYASVMATLESATEIVGANLTKGVGKSLAKGNIKNALLDYGLDVGENFLEEAVMEPLEEFTVTKVAGKDKADWDNIVQRSWNAGIDGALTAILMGGASAGVGKAVNVVNKINNGQTVTKMEIREAVQDVKDSGKIDIEKEIKDNIQQRLQEAQEIINNANSQQQSGVGINDTTNINQTQQDVEQGYLQNENNSLPVQNEENRYSNRLRQNAIDEINNSSISQNDKQQMLEVLNQTENVTEADIEAIKDTINEINKTEIENSKLDTNINYKDSQDIRKKYMQYKNDNTSYDSTMVDEVLNTSPANRNGRRTVKQWLNVAKEIGTRIAEKSNAEIEKIAYKSWFNEEPSKSITQYDSQSHTRANFQRFTSDEWINKIYEGVNEAREKNNYSNEKNQDTFYDNQENNINQDNSQLNDMLNNQDPSMQSYVYEKSDNVKIDKLRRDANKCFNNTEKAKNFVKMLEKIIIDKNIDIRLDGNLKTVDGKVANGSYSNGVITINPNSTRAGEFIAIHELTHAIGTEQLRNIVENYRNSNTEFDNAVKKLLQDYNETELTEEAMADVTGQLLGNQEFINNLSQTNPSIFKKIYNEIKYLWHQFTGYKNQDQFIEDLQYKWEQAYRSNNKLNNTTNYSIAGRKSLENIKGDTVLYNQAIKMYKEAENMAKQGKNNKEIINKTGWFRDPTGKLKFSFSDKDMNLKNINFHDNTVYKLEDILEHDTLFIFYPQLRNYEVEFKDLNKNRKSKDGYIKGSFNRKDKAIRLDINIANSKIDAEGTLIHEIQHAIQNIEGFTHGTSRKLGKRQYEKNLGEIEARDTTNRFTKEKYEGKNIDNILPKSAQIHKTILEKMKDGIYNYFNNFNKGEYNEEINRENKENFERDKILVVGRVKENNYTDSKSLKQESENNSDSFFNVEDFNKYLLPEIEERYKYESKSKITETLEDLKQQKEKINIDTENGWDKNFEINQKIKAIENGYDNIYDYYVARDVENLKKDYKNEDIRKNIEDKIRKIKESEKKQAKLNKEIEEATPLKKAQYELIKNTNPMFDDYHVGIRSPIDIKTFEEVIEDKDSFWWGDFSKEDAQKALKEGKITIYSSYPIKNGVFVSTSYVQAQQYAGGEGNRVYSKKVSLNNVAWINGDEGQYANVGNLSNEKYSKNNGQWQSYLEDNFKSQGTRTNLKDILPTAQRQQAPTAKNNSLSSELATSENYKFRKHYKSIIESQYTTDEAKAISKQLMKTDSYVPESNKKQLERADTRIQMSGVESELKSLMSRAMTGGNIKADDIAVGERLIQYYSKTGNKAKLQEAIQATAMAGTTAGQTVQAMSLLNHQTPEGQAVWLQRSVEKMNNDLKKKRGQSAEQFDLTPEMIDKIVNSKNETELQNNLDDVYKELGQQVSKSNIEKIDAWRYFSMLSNPKTHIRNIVGNVAMGKVQSMKNKVAGVIEGTVSKVNNKIERTHTIVPASQEVKQFAKNDILNVADRLELNDNKYNPKTRLENSMRTFKSDAMENTLGKLFELNNKALEVEDAWGLKSAYVKSLSEYMTANNLKPDTITDKQLAIARNYAVEQAKEATFHQASALASALNQFSNKNGITKFIADSTIPFKKTPINVAKAGIEYSPIGLTKSAIYDTVQLRKGNITVNQYIDNISKGLTGTGIAVLGYALANAGILKASGGDNKDKESYDEDRGMQTYSIQIGNNTYSLDWLAPTGIPLFIGAETYEIMQQENESKSSSSDEDSTYNKAIKSATNILDAFTNAMNPMTEMSMLSGLASALKSYDGDNSKMLANLGVNASKSYVNQFIPTALSQIAKSTDQYERSTTSTKTGTLPKAIDSTKNYAISKIPGLRQMLPVKTDIWGNDLKQNDNILLRTLENSAFPWTRKGITTNNVDKEITRLYNNTGESSVLPDNINKNITINKQKYVMTSTEYNKYKKEYGENSYKLLNSLVSSSDYKKLTDTQKQTAIENIYQYATEQVKVEYAKANKLEYEESKLSKTINAIKKSNANTSNYLEYLALTKDSNKTNEKLEVLTNSNYTSKTKQLIYENNLLSDNDSKYTIIKNTGLNIDSYLQYKLAESNGEFKADTTDNGTVKGKTISGSAKEKKINYINSIKGATYTQKLILKSLVSEPKSKSDKEQVINYIKTLPNKTEKERLDLLSNFSWITIYKNGEIEY